MHCLLAPIYRSKINGLVVRLNTAEGTEEAQAEEELYRLLTPKHPRIVTGAGGLRMNGHHLPMATPIALGALEETLRNGTDFARATAARIFGLRKEERILPHLLHALAAPSLTVRRGASEGLLHMAHPASVPALASVLEDTDPEVVRNAIEALGFMAGAEAVAALLAFYPQTDPETKTTVLLALQTSGDTQALPLIRTALSDPSGSVRKAAKSALGSFDLQRRRRQS